jgi:polysaccharide deacetylase family protein (PEP-CTERM system associated)
VNRCLLTFDIEDWFQVENLRPLFPPASWEAMPRRVAGSTRKVLDVLDEFQVRSTFFVLGWVADREPGLVREIARRGHEVACHGYGHVLPLRLSVDEFRSDIVRAKERLEQVTGSSVRGYRAPSFSIDRTRLRVVSECGFAYDSSHHPFGFHDRYGRMGDLGPALQPGVYRLPDGLVEVGLPVEHIGSVPVPVAGGAWFRLYPGAVHRALVRRSLRRQGHFVFYLHSWELDPDQPRVSGVTLLSRARHYTSLRRSAGRLRSLIQTLKDNGTTFQTVSAFLGQLGKSGVASEVGA